MYIILIEGNYPFVNTVQEDDRFSITWSFSTLSVSIQCESICFILTIISHLMQELPGEFVT